jgi:hypothetical protein
MVYLRLAEIVDVASNFELGGGSIDINSIEFT